MKKSKWDIIKKIPYLRKKEIERVTKHVKEWRQRNPEKIKAHRAIFVAIRNKSLERLPCVVCNEGKSEAHHEDYSKPLEVIWLCKKHHVEADIRLRQKVLHRHTCTN